MAYEKRGIKGNNKGFNGKCKEDHPAWVPTHTYEYCDKNPNTKDPKGRDERIAKRKARFEKRNGKENAGTSELRKLKATVAAQKKLLSINEAKTKAMEMEAAAKIVFDDDADLDVQATALQTYLQTLEANTVKAMGADEINNYTVANGIIDSGASATFVTSADKVSNATTHKTSLKTANGQRCFTSHMGKTALPVANKALHLTALVAPSFGEDLISVSQLTKKGNKILFTKNECLLLGPSASIKQGIVIGTKGKDNLYRVKAKLTMPKGHQVWNAKGDLPKEVSEQTWKTVEKKNGPRKAPEVRAKQAHDVLNHSNDKVIAWFKKEYPDAIKHMNTLCSTHELRSCPPCAQGKATRAPFKQQRQNRYALLEAVSSDTTGPIDPRTMMEANSSRSLLMHAQAGPMSKS